MKQLTFKSRLRLLAIMVLLTAMQTASAQGQKDLQQLLDEIPANLTRADGGITEIDISSFTEPYTTTLYVRNQSVRFVNGTITQAASFSGPLIQIQNGYTLELACTATLAGNNKKSDNPLVDVADGTFKVIGGNINHIYGGSNPNPNPQTIYNTSVELSGGNKASFSQLISPTYPAGYIEGNIENSKGGSIQFNGGYVDRISTSNGFMLRNTIVHANVYFYNQDITITLMSSLLSGLCLSNYAKDQMVISGIYGWPGGYYVTADDMEKLTLYNNVNNYQLSHEDNAVYVREAAPSLDPNNITNEDDLQKILDEIAAQKPTEPVEVKIADAGIVLTKSIWAGENCKATITGGPISVKQGFDNVLFYVAYDAYLGFSNISFDFRNAQLLSSCFWVYGELEMAEGVEYNNISSDIIKTHSDSYSYGFYVNYDGHVVLRGGNIPAIKGNVVHNMGVNNTGNIEMRGDLFKYGAGIYNYRNPNSMSFVIMGKIHLLSSIPETTQWTINGNWDIYPLETSFIEGSDGYTLQASDYWQMRFTGLPTAECDGYTQYFDGSTNSIKLKEYNSLQCLLDGGGSEVDVPCAGVDAGQDVNVDLQTLLDGGGCENSETEPPVIWLPGGCVFFPWRDVADPTIVRDVTFDSYSSGHRVYIRRRVTYERNVRARNFIVFIIVERGGYLIWRNAWTENVLYPIYNDGGTVDIVGGKLTGTSYNLNSGIFNIWGTTNVNIIDNSATLTLGGGVTVSEIKQGPLGILILASKLASRWVIDLTGHRANEYVDGQIIVKGGSDYRLTAADMALMDFRLPTGCSVTLDTSRNAIVLHVPMFPKGDVNLDMTVDVADISTVISIMANSGNGSQMAVADVNGDGAVDVADIATIISIMAGGGSGTTDPRAVNLGLPSGTLWASMNVGATSAEDFGSYFAWGETTVSSYYGWNSYKWSGNTQTSMTKYCTSATYGTVDGKTQLDLDDDAAHAAWGGDWHTPTIGDIEELINNTTNEWVTINGATGCRFKSKTNGNSIFLPAAGYYIGSSLGNVGLMGCYWSSTLQENEQYAAKILYVASGTAASDYNFYRYVGQPVRPVCKNGNSGGDDYSKYDNVIHPETPFKHSDGEMPCISVDQITATVDANGEALPGGANIIAVTTSVQIEYLYISISDQQGYYIKAVDSPEVSGGKYVYRVPLLFPQTWDYGVVVTVSGRTKDGRAFACRELHIGYHKAGTGALQVSLTFENEKDVDLHLYTPSGKHYFYGNKGGNMTDSNGNTVYAGLDIDSNAACHIDGKNAENITLPEEMLEEGTYRVVVNMYSNCDASIATGWTCVAYRGGQLISNQLSRYGNPASGVYPVGQARGDMTEVMRFTVEKSSLSRAAKRKEYTFIPVPLDEKAVMKLEEEKAWIVE